MTLPNHMRIVIILSLICVVVSVESATDAELQLMDKFLTDNVASKNTYLNFIALTNWLSQLKNDPEQKDSLLATNLDQFRKLYLNSFKKKEACSWHHFLDLKEFKTAAGFEYNWKNPDLNLPRISELLLDLVRKLANNCHDQLKSAYNKKVNSWLFNDSKSKRSAKLIDELIKQVTKDVDEEYGECTGDNCRVVDRIYLVSNNDYLARSVIIYRGIFNLGKKLGKPLGEWPKNEPARVNMEELKKVAHEYNSDPCYTFTRYHNRYLDAMVDYAYIVGRADEKDNARFYQDLDRYEFCELLL